MEPNGELVNVRAYLRVVRDVWDTFGLPTIILVILLLLWTGTIPSPVSEAMETIKGLKTSIEHHLERDDEILFYLKQMCHSNARLANINSDVCNWRPVP